MKSPFPGMDPYLEMHWGDVHLALTVYIADALVMQLSDDFFCRIKAKGYIEDELDDRCRSVLISERSSERPVTHVELLSPQNKLPGALQDYLRKRKRHLDVGLNLVEIDLIRAGDWRSIMGRITLPDPAATAYRVIVTTPSERNRMLLYPMPLQSRLAMVPVPLRPQDPPATLNLQGLVDRAYEMGRYDRTDYTMPCDPPLEGDDKVWADQLLSGWRG